MFVGQSGQFRFRSSKSMACLECAKIRLCLMAVPSKNAVCQFIEGIGFKGSTAGYFLGRPRLRLGGSSVEATDNVAGTTERGSSVTAYPIGSRRAVNRRMVRPGLRRSK